MTIIDGNNLLWALHEGFGEREITNEVELCRVLSQYFARLGETGQVVFDGAGPSDKSRFDTMDFLEVYFAGFHRDADSVVQEKILADTAPRHLTVVSNDREIRKAAGERKAKALKSEDFWQQVRQELSRRPPKRREPEEKREGLTDGETDKWLEAFGLEG
ncbi:MAG TPA: NYN domain-containing protein [Sedimentisphaerales bacterium]|nr:NYN domain-containing protein [Sedimentisphaerales bacterium]HOV76911.1 NYN domain-containing protein [Sedimentisphaerales bacterium]HQI27864.1 NYN domain-containing protein [Sedimentisphaerales bacterium]